MNTLQQAKEEWLQANDLAINEASTYLGKKGNFNPALEKPWPKYEELKRVANEKWHVFYNICKLKEKP